MNLTPVISYLIFLVIASIGITLYYRGWRKLSKRWPELFTQQRLILFVLGTGLFGLVLSPTVSTLASHYLSVRSIQKVLVSMIIPPILWSSLPLHAIISSFSNPRRNALTARLFRKSNSEALRKKNILTIFTQPGVVWLLFTSIFVIWHEPSFASWLIEHSWLNNLFIWTLLLVALLFWAQIVGTIPRVYRNVPGWTLLVALVAVEIPNMVAGVTVAFAEEPIYRHYVNIRQTVQSSQANSNFWLTVVGDQRLSGCITWITGTLVYVSAIMSVLYRLFKKEKGLPPILSFSNGADERTIAPGLEYRVYPKR